MSDKDLIAIIALGVMFGYPAISAVSSLVGSYLYQLYKHIARTGSKRSFSWDEPGPIIVLGPIWWIGLLVRNKVEKAAMKKYKYLTAPSRPEAGQ